MRGPAVYLGLVLLAGCGGGGPPPIRGAKRVEVAPQATAFTLPTDPAPATSDPAARAVIEAALKAHTDGQPARLDALRTARKTMAGTFTGPAGRVSNEWKFAWRWPDRWRTEMVVADRPPVVIRRVGAAAWMAAPGQGEQSVGQVGNLTGVQAETFAECLLLLFPLADPAAVFSPAAGTTVRGKRAVGVRVSGPGWPTAVLHFDPDHKRLVQASYAGSEGDVGTTKEVIVLSEKAVSGVTLPERMEIRWDGQEKGDWTLKDIQFPLPVEDKLFDRP